MMPHRETIDSLPFRKTKRAFDLYLFISTVIDLYIDRYNGSSQPRSIVELNEHMGTPSFRSISLNCGNDQSEDRPHRGLTCPRFTLRDDSS